MAVFPTSVVFGWSVKRTPSWPATIQKAVSGREARVQYQQRPLWRWDLTYEVLRDKWDTRNAGAGGGLGATYDELRTIMGFFLQMNGPFLSFFFTDPTDNAILGQIIATGNGAITTFQIVRTIGGYNEPITSINSVAAVYLNGVLQAGGSYSVNASTGILTFSGAPANGAVITVDFTYYFQVRFEQNAEEFEYFMYQLWKKQSLKLIQVF